MILIVDDQINIRTALKQYLTIQGYKCVLAASAQEALEILDTITNIKVVICDLRMPKINGLQFLKIYKHKYPESLVKFVLITEVIDLNTMRVSFKEGVLDYLSKPLDYNEVKDAVERGLKEYDLQLQVQQEQGNASLELSKANQLSKTKYMRILELLIKMLEITNPKLQEHSNNVFKITTLLVQEMQLPVKEIAQIKVAALLHDIGKISIFNDVSVKHYDASYIKKAKQHSRMGAHLVKEYLDNDVAEIILHHHERYDGRGYPLGLVGKAIPLGARIIAIANHYDYLRNTSYGLGLAVEDAVTKLANASEGTFDPDLVEIFLRTVEKMDEKVYKHEEESLPLQVIQDVSGRVSEWASNNKLF